MAITFQSANGSTGASTTLNIGTAGNDRLVVVTTGNEGTGNALSAVTVDGKSCTLVVRADNTSGSGNETEMWYITESGLGASTGSVTIAITGGDSGFGTHAQLFYGVADAGATDSEIDNTSTITTTVTVNNVTTADNDLFVYVGSNGSSNTWTSRTSPMISADTTAPVSAYMESGYGIETTGQVNKTYVLTCAAAFNRGSSIVAVWAEAGGGGVTIPIMAHHYSKNIRSA